MRTVTLTCMLAAMLVPATISGDAQPTNRAQVREPADLLGLIYR